MELPPQVAKNKQVCKDGEIKITLGAIPDIHSIEHYLQKSKKYDSRRRTRGMEKEASKEEEIKNLKTHDRYEKCFQVYKQDIKEREISLQRYALKQS